MRSRFVLMSAIVFAGLGAIHPSSAQQISSDVVISGASLNDGYGNSSCDEEGQLYRLRVNPRPGGDAISVQRVAKDGSTQLFTLTRPDWSIQGIAPSAQGLIVLANAGAEMGSHVTRVYRFDTQGNIRSERSVTFDFQPFALAEAKSGMTIVVGYRGKFEMKQDARTVGGAILDADDQVVKTFEFQPAADGSRWRFVSTHRIWADDHGASVILQSSDGDPNFEIATIDESGETKVLPLETVRGARFHDWYFAKGVAVEQYQFTGEKPPGYTKIDRFDMATGKNMGTKTLPGVGFAVACYLGDEMSMTAHSAHVEKSRGLPPDALRLVTVKLE